MRKYKQAFINQIDWIVKGNENKYLTLKKVGKKRKIIKIQT